ncbi:MAG: sterol desaturase family protein [Sandaracinaceae bacterium]|nr:sterol desaturase family protein [Sandaracinaceae bacterium]
MLTELLGLPTHPLTTFLGLVVGGLTFYGLLSTLSYFYFFRWRKERYHPRYVEDPVQIKSALSWSAVSLLGNAVLTTPFHLAVAYGWSEVYYDVSDFGWPWLFASIGIYLAVTETMIYWVHRALHWGPLWKYVHRPHHSFKQPTSFVGVAFNPLDSFAQGLAHHLCVFLFPVHVGVYLFFVAFVTVWAVMIHDRVSFVRWKGINYTGHHTVHHWYDNYNFGQFFTLWDRLGGTYKDPESSEVRAEVPEGVLRR